jgi:polysaccharide export outer membrane protein
MFLNNRHRIAITAALLGGFCAVSGQGASTPDVLKASVPVSQNAAAAEAKQPAAGDSSSYVLGPGDQLVFHVVDLEEINDKPVPVDLSGFVRLPMAGRIKVSGLTVRQVEVELAARLKTYLLQPDVSVSVAEFRSQPVSVLGAVRNPGVQQVQGRKTLIEMLSSAGGLDTTAGSSLKVTRRLEWGRIPLPNAVDDATGQYSVAEVSVKALLEARNPAENILVKPSDVISVPKAETIYVIGQVLKSGGFVLNDKEEISVLQALSMAGGLDRSAQPQNARILRRVSSTSARVEVPVDVKKILDGKTSDVHMEPEDILFVPASAPKKAAIRALEAAVQMGTGLVIYRR